MNKENIVIRSEDNFELINLDKMDGFDMGSYKFNKFLIAKREGF
jgi:hypothetical protein